MTDYKLARDRSIRQVVPPVRFSDYECEYVTYEEEYAALVCVLAEDGGTEPWSYQEAMEDPDRDTWDEAAHEELISLKNNTWILVDRPKTLQENWDIVTKFWY